MCYNSVRLSQSCIVSDLVIIDVKTKQERFEDCLPVVKTLFPFFAVPFGGEDSLKAPAGVCGVHRVECSPAYKGCECC